MELLDITIKASRASALATLVRILGDFDLAEEALQEAIYRAVIDWRQQAIPDNPVAWLVQTGRRYAIDMLRHNEIENQHRQNTIIPDQDWVNDEELEMSTSHLHDDQLRLLFTCCHPALSNEVQVALSLKVIAGLSVEEIARAFLLPVKTLEQRITRAKQKIRDAGIAYEIPDQQQITHRLEAVMSTIYLSYTQAYTTCRGTDLLDSQLSEAAIYQATMLNRLIRGNLEAQGLLALMLLQHSRAAARVDIHGLPIPLEEQNRQLWDQQLIEQGLILVEKFQRHRKPGPYQLQAAIAAVHSRAKQPQDTDWQEIVLLYELLEDSNPSPVITLNRAVAIARLHGPEHGLTLLDQLQDIPQMENFQYYHSARAGLLQEAEQYPAALRAYKKTLSLCKNEVERKYLTRKVDELHKHE